MSVTSRKSRLERLITPLLNGDIRVYKLLFAVCAVAAVIPIWVVDVLPLQDLAGNMSYAAILSGASDPSSIYGQHYELGAWWLPNGLGLHLWAQLGVWLGFITASKLLLSLYAIGFPVALDRLLVAAGRERRFTLVAFPIIYNSTLLMGFIGYATSIPIALYALALAYRYQRAPNWRLGVVVAFVSMLVFLGHAQAYLVLGLMAIAFVLTMAGSLRGFVQLAWPFALSLVIFIPWAWQQFLNPSDTMALGGGEMSFVWQDPNVLFGRMGDYTIARWTRHFDDWIFIGILAVFAIGTLDRGRQRASAPGEQSWLQRNSMELIAATVLVAYFLFVPEHTRVQACIGSRLVFVAVLLAIGGLVLPERRGLRGGLLIAMAALSLTYYVHLTGNVRGFYEEEVGDNFLPMVDALPDGSRLASFVPYAGSERVALKIHEHNYGYHYALNSGLSYSHFHSYAGRHVRWAPGHAVPNPGQDVHAFLRSKSACWYDFIMLRSHKPPRWGRLGNRLTYLNHSRHYSLWKIEKDRVPVCHGPERKGEKADGGEPDDVKTPSAPGISTLTTPRVGRTRGRDVRGQPRLEGYKRTKRRVKVPARRR